MTERDSCPECDRLWRAYAEATAAHARLIDTQQFAALRKDVELFRKLEEKTEAAGRARQDARQAIKEHEHQEHNKR